jgi:CheY-like chemotaxis protein
VLALSPENAGLTSTSQVKMGHILVVDDSPAILKMVSMMLRKLGFTVTTAMNGKAAVDVMKQSFSPTSSSKLGMWDRIEVILMDIQMPIMNGLDAIRCIREMEKNQGREDMQCHTASTLVPAFSPVQPCFSPICTPALVIIAMSANSEFTTYQDAIEAGADSFLNKPFTIELFQATLVMLRKKLY